MKFRKKLALLSKKRFDRELRKIFSGKYKNFCNITPRKFHFQKYKKNVFFLRKYRKFFKSVFFQKKFS